MLFRSTGALWYVMKKKFTGKGQPAIAAASASAKSSSKPKKARDVSQKDPTQPKKKNRKRVAERLAAEEAAKAYDEDCKKQATQLGLDWK